METEVGLAEFVKQLHKEVELFKLWYSLGIQDEQFPDKLIMADWEEQFESWRY